MIFIRKGCRRARLNVLERAEIGVDARKVLVLGPMWVSFLIGSIVGAFLQSHIGVYALLLPATLTGLVGLTYVFFRQKLKDQLKKIESNRLREEIDDLNETLSRTQSFVHEARLARSRMQAIESGDVIDLEEEFGQMLETMHQLEAELEDLYHHRSDAMSSASGEDIESRGASSHLSAPESSAKVRA